MCIRDSHFKNTANHDWNYQDIDFEILGAIIRQRTHGGYYHYIKKTILKPLNHHQLKMVYQVKPRKVLQTMQPGMTWQMLSQAASSEIGAGDLLLSPLNYWNFIYHGVLSKPKRSSPKCWCKLNSANLSFHKLKHTGFF